LDALKTGIMVARTEGIIPAPETTHALAYVIQEAEKAKQEGKEKVILFNWSGHGLLDLGSYDKYFTGALENYILSDEELEEAEKIFANYPKPQLLKSR
jgi:tryptophan synthase beta chain